MIRTILVIFFTVSLTIGIVFLLDRPKRIALVIDNETTLTVEVALSDEAKERGLGERKRLGRNNGMLYVFDRNFFHIFNMKDMLFPIDIIWINKDKKIVDVAEHVQIDSYPDSAFINDFLAQYVLEVNAGFFDEYGVELGDFVEFSLEEFE